jgi:hypothetical protein
MEIRELGLKPKAGTFDVARIRRYLEEQSFAGLATEGGLFIIAKDGDHLQVAQDVHARIKRFGGVSLVELGADFVMVTNGGDADVLRNARSFVQWMLDNFDCVVDGDVGEDLTAFAAKDAGRLYRDGL